MQNLTMHTQSAPMPTETSLPPVEGAVQTRSVGRLPRWFGHQPSDRGGLHMLAVGYDETGSLVHAHDGTAGVDGQIVLNPQEQAVLHQSPEPVNPPSALDLLIASTDALSVDDSLRPAAKTGPRHANNNPDAALLEPAFGDKPDVPTNVAPVSDEPSDSSPDYIDNAAPEMAEAASRMLLPRRYNGAEQPAQSLDDQARTTRVSRWTSEHSAPEGLQSSDLRTAAQLAVDAGGLSVQALVRAGYKRPQARRLLDTLIKGGLVADKAEPQQPHALIPEHAAPLEEPFDAIVGTAHVSAEQVQMPSRITEGLVQLRGRLSDMPLRVAMAGQRLLGSAVGKLVEFQRAHGTRATIAAGFVGAVAAYGAVKGIDLLNDSLQYTPSVPSSTKRGDAAHVADLQSALTPSGNSGASSMEFLPDAPVNVPSPGVSSPADIPTADSITPVSAPDYFQSDALQPQVSGGSDAQAQRLAETLSDLTVDDPETTVWDILEGHDVPSNKIMSTLERAAKAAQQDGMNVQWHGSGESRWVSVNGQSDPATVVKMLAPYFK